MRPARLMGALAAALALVGSLACAPALRHPTAEDGQRASGRWPGAGLAELEAGRTLYVARCSRCHGLFLPEDRTQSRWPDLLGLMSAKAKLSPGELELVTRFVLNQAELPK